MKHQLLISCLFLTVIVALLAIILVKQQKCGSEGFWHGWRGGGWEPRWGASRWGPRWGFGRWNWNDRESNAYLNCIRNHADNPNKDELCCQTVFGTSCVNI